MHRTTFLSLLAAVLLAAACSLAMKESDPAADPATTSASAKTDNAAVEAAVAEFAEATRMQDVFALEAILHDNYRAIVNDFPTAGKVAELPRAAYVGMIEGKKIGVKTYELNKRAVSVVGNVANAVYDFVNDEEVMHQNLLFFRAGTEGDWQLVTSAPVVRKK